ncbi:hypothetical protein ACLB2K_007774 [Fragaria x ananassa]
MFKPPTGVRNHGGLVGVRCEGAQQEDRDDGFYMPRCVELARKAIGRTSPNRMVGCVIVKDGKVVGEGFHPKAGQPHAKVFALRDAGELAEMQLYMWAWSHVITTGELHHALKP